MSEAKLTAKQKPRPVITENSAGDEATPQSIISEIIKRCKELETIEQMPIYQSMVLTAMGATGIAVILERASAFLFAFAVADPEKITIPFYAMAVLGYDVLLSKLKHQHGITIDAIYKDIEANLNILSKLVINNPKDAKLFSDFLNLVISDEMDTRLVHRPFKELISALKSPENTARIKKAAVEALKLINHLSELSRTSNDDKSTCAVKNDDSLPKDKTEVSNSDNLSKDKKSDTSDSDALSKEKKRAAEHSEKKESNNKDEAPLENKHSLRRLGTKNSQNFGEPTRPDKKDYNKHSKKTDKFNSKKFKKSLAENNLSELESQLIYMGSSPKTKIEVLSLVERHLSQSFGNPKTRNLARETATFVKNYLIIKDSEKKKKILIKSRSPTPTAGSVSSTILDILDTTPPEKQTLDIKTPTKKYLTPELLIPQRNPAEALAALVEQISDLKQRKLKKNEAFIQDPQIIQAAQLTLLPDIKFRLESAFELMQIIEKISAPRGVVYGVGGWPLFMLQGLENLKDIDLVTNLNADDLIEVLKELKKGDGSFRYRKYSKLGAQVVFEIQYQGIKFDLQADPGIKLRPNGQVDRLSLVENAEKRNYNINGIFIDSNGEFPVIFPEIEKLISKSLKSQGFLKAKAGVADDGLKLKASPGHLVNTDIECLIPDWKNKILVRSNSSSDGSFARELEITVKNYIADPKRMFDMGKLQNKSQLSQQEMDPAINRVFSDPHLLECIFIAAVKMKKNNIMQIVLGLEGLLNVLLSQELNNPLLRPTVPSGSESVIQGMNLPEKKVHPKLNVTTPLLQQSVPTSEGIRTDIFLPACRQRLKNCWKETRFYHLFLLALKAEASVESAKKIEAGCQFLFSDSQPKEIKSKHKPESTAQPNDLQNWLLDRLIKVNIVGSLNSFRDQISLGVSDIFPCRADKMLPFAMAVWWQQNCNLTEFPAIADFRKQITKVIDEIPFLQHAFSALKDFQTILDDAYTNFCKDLGITPVSAAVITGGMAGSHSFKSPLSSSGSRISSGPEASVTVQHSNSASYWNNKTGQQKSTAVLTKPSSADTPFALDILPH